MNAHRTRKPHFSTSLAALLMALLTAAGPADAQGTKRTLPACTVPSTYASRWVCDSAYMTSMFAMVEDRARQLQQANPMRVTLQREQKNWVATTLGSKTIPASLPDIVASRYRLLERARHDTANALEARPHQADLEKTCVALAPPLFETLALSCRVVAVEGIAPGLLGQRHTWFGPLGPDGRDQGLSTIQSLAVLQAIDPAAAPQDRTFQLVGWVGADEATLGKPLYITDGHVAYISMPQNSMGTSAASGDLVIYRSAPGKPWQEIDADSWARDLDSRLPRGLTAKLNYSLDLLSMRATTDIARASDPNCCPSGGTADITLALKGDTLVIDSLVLRRPPPPARAKGPGH